MVQARRARQGNSRLQRGRSTEARQASAYVARGQEWLKDAIAGSTEPDKAIADFSRAIELDPKRAAAYYYRADAEQRRRAYAGALRDLSTLVQVDGGTPIAHQALARILATCRDASIRDGKRAVAEATRAYELTAWKDANCLDTLAAAYAETRDFPAAIKWQKQAIAIASSETDPKSNLEFAMRDRLARYEKNEPCRE
jgi:tetratricopeptide (TPR) repeat protein